jgi:tripartite-type tricarboxylate transporter receptor subunit TctC
MDEFGLVPAANTPEEFAAFIRAEITRWSRVAKAAHVKMD